MKKYFSLLLFSAIVIQIVYLVTSNPTLYTKPYNHEEMAEIYTNSQYVKGSGSVGISDDGLYAFAGYYYLQQGGDPTTVNFENPPLGKYLIGLSILLFGNANAIYILYALGTVILTYLLAKQIFKSTLSALLSAFLLSFSHLFIIQYVSPRTASFDVSLLDLPLTFFFLCSVYFFLRATTSVRAYFFSTLFLGMAFSTKFFPALILLVPVFGAYQYVQRPEMFKIWLLSLLIIPLVYVVSYVRYFAYHPSPLEFINFHKYLISWRLGNPTVFGNIFRTIFTGGYKNWWNGGVVRDSEWTIGLPVIVALSMCGAYSALKDKRVPILFLVALCLVYLIYLAIGSVGVARYLLLIYPLLVIIATSIITSGKKSKHILTHRA